MDRGAATGEGLAGASRPRRITFISSNPDWGGSELLWSAAAAALAEDGHIVSVLQGRIDESEPRIRRLRELGCPIRNFRKLPFVPRWLQSGPTDFGWPIVYALKMLRLHFALWRARPDLVVLSQSGNLDGLYLLKRVRRRGLPYVIICHKATDMEWPEDRDIEDMRSHYRDALACWFVSRQNLLLTEEQIGTRFPHASVVRNPFLVPWEGDQNWPDASAGLRLACVGRLHPREKGQDMLLRVLARDKWKQRPVHVSFFGSGQHEEALRRMAGLLELENVTFAGYAEDAATIWRDHHALLLSSRAEGLPIVIVEAMLCGRVPIVTDVGGAEVITDNVDGFLAAAPTEDSFDEALERAWQRRDEWPSIGKAAADTMRRLVPPDPVRPLADRLAHMAAGLPAEPERLEASQRPGISDDLHEAPGKEQKVAGKQQQVDRMMES